MLKILLVFVVFAACDACRKIHCPGYGTFYKKGPYKHWPLPDCPETLNVKMHLYTRSNRNFGQIISASTIPSRFRTGKRTIFIVHGYWHANKWFPKMKNALLTKGDFNVITVDWDSKSFYSKAASNTRTAGAAVAKVAKHLVSHSRVSRQQLWCMGQSLGAHVCGNAGKTYRLRVVRAGLDPAGPKFKNNRAAGLVPQSADFVDAIHTGASFFGMMTPVGHVDFYPNGGKQQPGCESFWKLSHIYGTATRLLLRCSKRARFVLPDNPSIKSFLLGRRRCKTNDVQLAEAMTVADN
ncbi:hypothetical protein NP493_303g00000 [Ridgeia piscesae]|uniref:Lipase domain-containing protein n=1 Tax=Ridgeia piscesae TaxID=27915 RepID=A0AAD9L5A6_RIDPI|nr:hypothetical protein NP493_303g00000 [Ridgeia piscesae]